MLACVVILRSSGTTVVSYMQSTSSAAHQHSPELVEPTRALSAHADSEHDATIRLRDSSFDIALPTSIADAASRRKAWSPPRSAR